VGGHQKIRGGTRIASGQQDKKAGIKASGSDLKGGTSTLIRTKEGWGVWKTGIQKG